MSKYTKQELKDMANAFLEYGDRGDPRYMLTLTLLSEITGLDPYVCVGKIVEMANDTA